ncbi:MAG: bifunctional oligoribonuclease/PAP phosphatase NrnA [Gemmataceae bacterium]|nr:bifunctional oligoribonuclease/PAP phosphatase NrnA [Gemmataceae bacterium]
MTINFEHFRRFLDGKSSILISTHGRPDGDAIGSCLAMAELLKQLGKESHVCFPTPPSSRYDFLLAQQTFQTFDAQRPPAVTPQGVLILDTGTWNQLGDFGSWVQSQMIPICVIDHHETQDQLGFPVLVDTTAEATGRLVFEAFQEFVVEASPVSANALFVALATDTGWFRHANTSSRTFQLGEKLVALGANPTRIYDSLYENNRLSRQKLIGIMLSRSQFRPSGTIVFSWLTQNDLTNAGSIPADTEDIISFLRATDGADVVVFFLETGEDRTRINFRSRSGLDVCRIATQIGGGGHKLAAGASIDLPLPKAMEKVFALLESNQPASTFKVKAVSP